MCPRRGAHGAQSDQLLLNCRNHAARPIRYITDTPSHTFTAATRSTRHAYAPRTAQNAPRLEPDHTPESRQYRPLGGSTRQPTTALICAGRGGDSFKASLHTRARSALSDRHGAPPGGTGTRRAGGGHLLTFMVSNRLPACAPWSGWIRGHLDQSPAAHTSRQRRLGSSYKTRSRAQRSADTTSENVAARAAGEHACDAPMTHKRDGAAGVGCPSRRRPCCCRGLPVGLGQDFFVSQANLCQANFVSDQIWRTRWYARAAKAVL